MAAFIAFSGSPVLLGIALLIYGLGMRHGFDADHIAAIDNVTRKLMSDGQQPVAIGFFFAVGHSGLVIVVTLAIAHAASSAAWFEHYRAAGAAISQAISGTFLIAVAIANIFALRTAMQKSLSPSAAIPSFAARLVRAMRSSWHMLVLGVLFGLSFDTASEIAMFSLSAGQASNGMPLHEIAILPLLFTAGMTLVDTIDGLLVVGAYRLAVEQPERRRTYNLVVTSLSIALALSTGMLQLLPTVDPRFMSRPDALALLATVSEHSSLIGASVLAFILIAWAGTLVLARRRQTSDEATKAATAATTNNQATPFSKGRGVPFPRSNPLIRRSHDTAA
ncbi:HoxN/HupN/NixA family nickel/cobalt transporter [Sphingomonas sp. BN140010]|uniref:Nickel/cobalt efflux system n=1 Tax=Sphingomonas arvum TaxID=2992113 RepID=A0ABT3JDQ7_9SPHN|nr:HoxN/HupN/NixA family nickel/cobalt transporter [Sphingomonas sp. BN140010]MCW3797203.1 HoxN/HupN/NixA family nickel/cobalt transporter [Sphingomonas sp. BN140010]